MAYSLCAGGVSEWLAACVQVMLGSVCTHACIVYAYSLFGFCMCVCVCVKVDVGTGAGVVSL